MQLSVVSQILSIVLNLAGAIILARWLGPTGKGVLSVFLSAAFFGAVLYGFGIVPAVSTWVSKGLLTLRQSLAVGSLAALLTCGLAAATIAVAPGLVPVGRNSWYVVPMIVSVMLSQVQLAAAQGVGEMRSIVVNNVVSLGLQVAVFAALAVSAPADPIAAVLGWLLAQNVGTGVGWWHLFKLTHERTPERPSALGGMLRFGLSAAPAQVLTAANARLDILLLASLSGSAITGQYSMAVTGVQLLSVVPASVAQAMAVEFGSEQRDSGESVAASFRLSLFAAAATGLLLALAAWPTVRFALGSRYAQTVPMLWIMLPGMVAYSIVPIAISYYWHARSRGMQPNLIVGTAVTVDAILLLLLVRPLGAYGAAAAASVAYLIAGLLAARIAATGLNCHLRDLLVPRRSDFERVRVAVRRRYGGRDA